MAAKIDYEYHQQQLIALAEQDPSITVQAYCEQAGLKYASARRHLKSPRKSAPKAKAEKAREIKTTRKRAGARDWPRLYTQYLDSCIENPGYNMTQFAEINGIPAAQVRKQFAALRKSGDYADREDRVEQAIAQAKGEKSRQKAKAKSLNKRAKPVKPTGRGVAPTKAEDAQNEKDHQTGSGDPLVAVAHQGRDGKGRFTHGNRFSTVHGGYAALAGLDDELVQVATDVDPVSLANELVTARSQYLSMLRFVARQREELIAMYERGEPLKDFDDNEIPLTKALGDLEFGTAGRLRSLEASIGSMVGTQAKIITDFTKLAHKEHELSPVDTVTALAIRKKLMQQRIANDWSALETARQFESRGIAVPKSIMIEAEREIATYEPPVDDSGLSDDELDKLTAEYLAEQQRVVSEDLPERRKIVAEMIDEVSEEDFDDEPGGDEATSDDDDDDDEDIVAAAFDDLGDFAPIEGEGADFG